VGIRGATELQECLKAEAVDRYRQTC